MLLEICVISGRMSVSGRDTDYTTVIRSSVIGTLMGVRTGMAWRVLGLASATPTRASHRERSPGPEPPRTPSELTRALRAARTIAQLVSLDAPPVTSGITTRKHITAERSELEGLRVQGELSYIVTGHATTGDTADIRSHVC